MKVIKPVIEDSGMEDHGKENHIKQPCQDMDDIQRSDQDIVSYQDSIKLLAEIKHELLQIIWQEGEQPNQQLSQCINGQLLLKEKVENHGKENHIKQPCQDMDGIHRSDQDIASHQDPIKLFLDVKHELLQLIRQQGEQLNQQLSQCVEASRRFRKDRERTPCVQFGKLDPFLS